MLIHINQDIRERYGLLSIYGLRTNFILPEMYYTPTLGDFVEHRHEIKPTKGWRLSGLGRSMRETGEAVVIINSTYCKQIESAPSFKESINSFLDNVNECVAFLKFKRLNPEVKVENSVQTCEDWMNKSKNCLLYYTPHSHPVVADDKVRNALVDDQILLS